MQLTEVRRAAALGALSLALALAGCPPGAGTADGGAAADVAARRILVRSVALEGSTEEPATVVVSGVADEDGVADQTWRASFELDDGTGAGSLAADRGGDEVRELEVRATQQGDGQVLLKRVTLRLRGDAGAGDGGAAEDAGQGEHWTRAGEVEVGEGFNCGAASSGPAPRGLLFCLGLLAAAGLGRRRPRTRSIRGPVERGGKRGARER